MTEPRMNSNPSHLANLPYELRQRVFRYALQHKGTVGLQTPTWDHGSAFRQPLFRVCHSFRDESLEAFYQTNTFVWHIHRPHSDNASPDSEPTKYPLALREEWPLELTPSLPWQYPRLMKDLRFLSLNIFMPSDRDPNVWETTFPEQLRSLVTALNKGGKLKVLNLTIITGYWRNGRGLAPAQLKTMGMLGQLTVSPSASIRIRCQPSYWQCSEDIYALKLEEKIKS